jgi:hypothetical protein
MSNFSAIWWLEQVTFGHWVTISLSQTDKLCEYYVPPFLSQGVKSVISYVWYLPFSSDFFLPFYMSFLGHLCITILHTPCLFTFQLLIVIEVIYNTYTIKPAQAVTFIFFGSPAGPWRKHVKLCPWFRVSITCVLLYIYWHVACNIIQNIYRKHHVINCLFLNILYSNCQQAGLPNNIFQGLSCLGAQPVFMPINVNLICNIVNFFFNN